MSQSEKIKKQQTTYILAPQDDFGMQKKLGKQTKKSGFGSDPPPSMGKIPT